jgi:hypothetical protein
MQEKNIIIMARAKEKIKIFTKENTNWPSNFRENGLTAHFNSFGSFLTTLAHCRLAWQACRHTFKLVLVFGLLLKNVKGPTCQIS